MNIDWSKAPEGATHYDTRPHGTPAFMKRHHDDPNRWNYWNRDGELIYYGFMPDDQVAQMIQRPHVWTGEGRPPAGVACEIHHACWALNDWEQTDIKYISSDYLIVGGGVFKSEQHFHMSDMSFRPIRTAEQIAAEERETAIDRMIDETNILTGIMSHRRIMAGQLYDAGYRKQEQK